MGSLQSALLGFGLFKALGHFSSVLPLGTHELVLLQATSVAAATMPLAGGFVGILPAFAVMSPEQGGPIFLPVWKQLLWCLALAPLGVFVAVPLREAFIVRAKLRFPSGTATAEMVSVLQGEHDIDLDSDAPGDDGGEGALEDSAISAPAPAPELDSGEEEAQQLLQSGPPHGTTSPASPASMRSKWQVLVVSMAASALLALVMHYVPIMQKLPVMSALGAPRATAFGWTLTPSLAYVGQGLIMGPHTTLSMLLGAVLGWGVLGPVAQAKGWAPGATMDSTTGARGWITWVSLALMLGDTLTALVVLVGDMLAPSLRKRACPWAFPARRNTAQHSAYAPVFAAETELAKPSVEEDVDAVHPRRRQTAQQGIVQRTCAALVAMPQRMRQECADTRWCSFASTDEVPAVVWLPGLFLSGLLCVAIVAPVMNIDAGEVVVAVILAVLVAPLAIRALGVSDLNPTSGLGKLSQGVFAGVAPGNVVSNLMAGAVAEAAAQQAGDMSQDNKTAFLLGTSPLAMFYGQMFGSFASVLFTVAAYALYTAAYTVPGPELAAPTSAIWLDMANLISGHAHPPAHIGAAAGIAGAVAVLAAAVGAGIPLHLQWLIPSGTAAGVGMYLTPNWTIPRVIGGLAQALWARWAPAHHKEYMIVVASGFVLGEGIMSIVTAALTAAGAGDAWSCAGCGPDVGCSGGCS